MKPFYTQAPPAELRLGAVSFLAPWEDVFEDKASINYGMFDGWKTSGKNVYRRTDQPQEADFHVLYSGWRQCNSIPEGARFAQQQVELARQHGKKILIWCEDDLTDRIDWPANAIALRHAISRSTRHPCEVAPPIHHRDIQTEGADYLEGIRSDDSISFCGHAPPLRTPWGRQRIKDTIKLALYATKLSHSDKLGQVTRAYAILAFSRQQKVRTNFLLREAFAFNKWGVLEPGGSAESARVQRREFVQNMAASEYALCVRGIANCSIRLYEAMCMGRIPVVLDTDMVFPAESLIPWHECCVVIDEADVHRAADKLRAYTRSTPSQVRAEQGMFNRSAWEKYLSVEGFFENGVQAALAERA